MYDCAFWALKSFLFFKMEEEARMKSTAPAEKQFSYKREVNNTGKCWALTLPRRAAPPRPGDMKVEV
jgi:hypothetical protein